MSSVPVFYSGIRNLLIPGGNHKDSTVIGALLLSLVFGISAALACLLTGHGLWAALAYYSVVGTAGLFVAPALHRLYGKANEAVKASLHADDLTQSSS